MNLNPALSGLCPPECVPDITNVVIDDGAPVDGITTEKQMRLLTEPLYSSWSGNGEPFKVFANVGLFHTSGQPPLVPDVMLSLDIRWPEDLSQKENQSYFAWLVGKMPDVVIEIVSNREGGEGDRKLRDYARLYIPYYVIYDPDDLLGGGVLRMYELSKRRYRLLKTQQLEETGLGLILWKGTFEDTTRTWLRWTDAEGKLILTAAEGRQLERQRVEQQQQRTEQETQRAEQERQRAEQHQQRAEQETQRAEQERQRAEQERQRAEQLQQRAEQETQRAEQERQRAEQERQRAEQLQQRAEQETQRAEQQQQRAEQETQRAEQERQRAEQHQQRAEEALREVERLRAKLRERD